MPNKARASSNEKSLKVSWPTDISTATTDTIVVSTATIILSIDGFKWSLESATLSTTFSATIKAMPGTTSSSSGRWYGEVKEINTKNTVTAIIKVIVFFLLILCMHSSESLVIFIDVAQFCPEIKIVPIP